MVVGTLVVVGATVGELMVGWWWAHWWWLVLQWAVTRVMRVEITEN